MRANITRIIALLIILFAAYILFDISVTKRSPIIKLIEKAEYGGDVLAIMEVLLAFFGILMAVLAFWVGRKVERIEELERMIEDVKQTILLGTEIALVNLPDFSVTQHIPIKSMNTLEEIDKYIYQEKTFKNLIEKSENGDKIKLAMGVYKYGLDDPGCIRLFEEIISTQRGELTTRKIAKCRLGIAYRQFGEFDKSINTFKYLFQCCHNDAYFRKIATVGLGLTYLAKYKSDLV